MNLKKFAPLLAILFCSSLIFVSGCGNSKEAQRQADYAKLKGELKTNADNLTKELSSAQSKAQLDKITAGNNDLKALAGEYAKAVTDGADAKARTAIAQRYFDKVEEVSKASSELMKGTEQAQVELAATVQVMQMAYSDLLQKDIQELQTALDPINLLMKPIQDVSRTVAPVIAEARQNIIARVNGGATMSEELQKEELLKAIEKVLGQTKS